MQALNIWEKWLADLDIIMKELIDIDEEMVAHEQTVDEIYQKLVQGERIVRAVVICVWAADSDPSCW
jgi:hypothetical protein